MHVIIESSAFDDGLQTNYLSLIVSGINVSRWDLTVLQLIDF